jgi:WXG100 family type VII secretion target
MSFDGGIKVVHASLDQAANDMLTTVKHIDDRMSRLEHDLAPLRQDWIGSAKNSYDVAKAKWDQAIQDMRDLLNETHVSVMQSNQDYMSADKRGAASFEY